MVDDDNLQYFILEFLHFKRTFWLVFCMFKSQWLIYRLSMAEELEIDEADIPPASPKKKIILIALVVLLLIGGGVGAFFMLSGSEEEVATEEGVEVEEGVEAEEKDEAEKLDPNAVPAPALYYNMEPELVINLAQDSEQTYLVVKISLMTRDEVVMGIIESNYPLLRSLIIEILSSQRSQDLRTSQGKTNLKDRILSDIQEFMKQEIGVVGVEKILFTHFIME